jgi:hypothetical protein
LTRRTPLFKRALVGRNPLFKIGRNPLFKTAVAGLLSRGSGRHGKGKNPVNGYLIGSMETHRRTPRRDLGIAVPKARKLRKRKRIGQTDWCGRQNPPEPLHE